MQQRLPSALAVLLTLCGSSVFGQIGMFPDDCTAVRAQVKAGKLITQAPDISSAKVITASDFTSAVYSKTDDPAKRPSKIAPSSYVNGEGILYRIDGLELQMFANCHDSIELDLVDKQGKALKGIYALFPASACMVDGKLKDAVVAARNNYYDNISVWGGSLWRQNFVNLCGNDGGDGKGNQTVSVVGYSFWFDSGGTSTPMMTLSPVVAILDGSSSGGGGNGGGSGGGTGGGSGGGSTPAAPANVTAVISAPSQQPLSMTLNQKSTLPVTLYPATGFEDDVSLTASVDADESNGFNVGIAPGSIHLPSDNAATLTVQTGPATFPREYHVTVTATTASDGARYSAMVPVTLVCDPPMILTTQHPKNVTVAKGQPAVLQVSAVGSGPLQFHWFQGYTGSTYLPVGTNSATFTAPSNSVGANDYWVRITNACGSTDSKTATVTVTQP